MLACLPDTSLGFRALARSGRLAFGSGCSGPCRNPRRSRAGSVGWAAVGGVVDVGDTGVSPSGTLVAAVCRWRRSGPSGQGTRNVTLGRRRRARRRRSLCAALGMGLGSAWRQSSTGVRSGAIAGSSAAAALRPPPVICPVSRSVSYQSTSSAPGRGVFSSMLRRLTVASGGGSFDRLPLPVSLLIATRITLASMTSDNVHSRAAGR